MSAFRVRRLVPLAILLVTASTVGGLDGPASASPASAATVRSVQLRTVHIQHSHRQAAKQSLNWSGYIKTGSKFASTSASWRVPTLKTTHNGYSSTWVGIDGASSGDQYLIQTGTEADVIGGRAEYHAWWEIITPTDPAPETLFSTLTIHPGDSIRASVAKTTNGRWKMSLRDVTTGKTASHTAAFAGAGKSAEWIQEDTDVNGYISPAPNWQTIQFSSITVNGANPRLVASQATDIVDSRGTREDQTGAPNKAGNGFTVTWLAPGTRTQAG